MPERKISSKGTTVHIDSPKGKKQPKISVIVASDEVVGGFMNFLREHAVVGLAIGLVIGTQLKVVVDQIVNSFINPLFTLIFGGAGLNKRTFTIDAWGHTGIFGWGAVVYTLIDFMFIMAAIYFIIKFFKLEKLDKNKEEKESKEAK